MSTRLVVAFDTDDTLIVPSVATGLPYDTPNYATIALYKWFQAQGAYMIIWSGSGVDWARTWADKLGLEPDEIRAKLKENSLDVDIAFDDCLVEMGTVNVRVPRVNNRVDRSEWNKTKRS